MPILSVERQLLLTTSLLTHIFGLVSVLNPLDLE